jgi:polysaccharide export outer membrane protein
MKQTAMIRYALILALVGNAVPTLVANQGPQSVLRGPQASYTIRAQDVVAITVWDWADLNNVKYTVDPDGTLMFPLIGRVKVTGLTAPELAAELKKRLSEGYFVNPQVTVRLEQYRAPSVFVFGAVASQGTYQLADGMTLVEVLARAGYGAASEAIIVRTKGATGPVLPGDNAASEVIRVNLRDFEKEVSSGHLSSNVVLADNDTVFVPRTDATRVFITGEVKTQGAYSVAQGTTVLEVIQLAGGLTENASTRRLQIIRIVDGKRKVISAKLTDTVNPGDTVNVRERLF